MKKIIVTGAQGYIGSVLIPYLLSHSYDVVGYDIGFFKDCQLPSYDNCQDSKNKNYSLISKDVRDINSEDIDGFDALIHLAGISNDPLNKLPPEKIYDPTKNYTFKLAKLCKDLNIKFIFASSCSVYGASDGIKKLTENSITNPITGYSINKYEIEKDLESLADKNFSPIALRFATIFGISPRIRFDIVINMLVGMAVSKRKIILNSDGEAWRPNLYIDDACRAILMAIEYNYKEPKLLKLNIGREDSNLKIIEIAKIIQSFIPDCEIKFLKSNPDLDKEKLIIDRKINDGNDKRTYQVSFDLMNKTFKNTVCEIDVYSGIEKLIKFFENINLNEKIFKSKEFYRLQYLEYLYDEKLISDELELKNNV